MTSPAPVIQRTGPSIRTCIELSIGRSPGPDSGGLSKADAAWPGRLRRIVRAGLKHWGRPDLTATAELLLTELVTNGLSHGSGDDIRVRLYLDDNDCVIEVRDGSPIRPVLRHAAPLDEDGRGLFLVDALSKEWGVSPDGTTTWCSFPLTEGPPDMEPAAMTAPVLCEMPLNLPADDTAMNMARIEARTLLTMVRWPGNVATAVNVLHCLVDNAVHHGLTPGKEGQSLGARLRVTAAHELMIEVTDPNPKFPDFETAVNGEHGLGQAQQLGAKFTWYVTPGFRGKTVRATMRPGRVDL